MRLGALNAMPGVYLEAQRTPIGPPRTPRADQVGRLFQALNRRNSRARILRKQADYEAFERILAEGLERYEVQLVCFQLGASSLALGVGSEPQSDATHPSSASHANGFPSSSAPAQLGEKQ